MLGGVAFAGEFVLVLLHLRVLLRAGLVRLAILLAPLALRGELMLRGGRLHLRRLGHRLLLFGHLLRVGEIDHLGEGRGDAGAGARVSELGARRARSARLGGRDASGRGTTRSRWNRSGRDGGRAGAHLLRVDRAVDLAERLGAALERLGIERRRQRLGLVVAALRHGGNRSGGGTRAHHRRAGGVRGHRASEHRERASDSRARRARPEIRDGELGLRERVCARRARRAPRSRDHVAIAAPNVIILTRRAPTCCPPCRPNRVSARPECLFFEFPGVCESAGRAQRVSRPPRARASTNRGACDLTLASSEEAKPVAIRARGLDGRSRATISFASEEQTFADERING